MDKEQIKQAWLKIFGFIPSTLDDDALYKHPAWKASTPKVDKLAKEIERERAKGHEWNPKTQSWEKATVKEWPKIDARLPLMPVDQVKVLFPGAHVLGSEITAEELAMIEANTTKGYRDEDNVWHKVEDDSRPKCQHKFKNKICGGPIVEVTWPDKVVLQCHYCGRAVS
jgi:hypothetical protein